MKGKQTVTAGIPPKFRSTLAKAAQRAAQNWGRLNGRLQEATGYDPRNHRGSRA
jgi:hypothetical protein